MEPAAIGHIVAAHRLAIRIRIGRWNSGPHIQDDAHFNLWRCGAHRAHRHAVSEQKVMRRREGGLHVLYSWRHVAAQVTEPCGAERLIQR